MQLGYVSCSWTICFQLHAHPKDHEWCQLWHDPPETLEPGATLNLALKLSHVFLIPACDHKSQSIRSSAVLLFKHDSKCASSILHFLKHQLTPRIWFGSISGPQKSWCRLLLPYSLCDLELLVLITLGLDAFLCRRNVITHQDVITCQDFHLGYAPF